MATTEYRGFSLKNRAGGQYDWFVTINNRTRWGSLAEVKSDVDAWLMHAEQFTNRGA